jgi:hypothetical protein
VRGRGDPDGFRQPLVVDHFFVFARAINRAAGFGQGRHLRQHQQRIQPDIQGAVLQRTRGKQCRG